MDASILATDRYLLEPGIILTPDGPVRGQAMAVEAGAIGAVGAVAEMK